MSSIRSRLSAGILASLAAGMLHVAFAADDGAIRFQRLTVEDGLSQSSVNAIVQGPRGFLWLGTQDGLNRYDGYTFRVYKHDDTDPGSIAHNFVWAVLIDRHGDLWVGTDGGGLDRWDPSRDRFVHHRSVKDDPTTLPHDRVRALAEGPDGTIWVGTDAGLGALDPESGKFTRFPVDPADPKGPGHGRVRALHVGKSGSVFVGTDGGGLARLDPGVETFFRYPVGGENPAALGHPRVRTILEDRRGAIWVGTYEGGLHRLDPTSGTFVRYTRAEGDPDSLPHDRVRTVFEDRDGVIWVGTDAGLARYRPDEGGFATFRHDPADPNSLGNDRVLSLYQDRGGVLWAATQAGLSRWNPGVASFAHIRQEGGRKSTLSANVVNAIAEGPEGRIWIGTYGGGLDAWDRKKGTFENFRNAPSDPRSLADDRVMSLLWDRAGTLWVGTFERGLDRYDPRTRRFEHFRKDPALPGSLAADGVTGIREAPDGTIWVATFGGGLNRFDAESRQFVAYRHDPKDPRSLSSDRVMCLLAATDGTIWAGTEGGGLNRLNPSSGAFERIARDPSAKGALTSDVIWSVLEARDGSIWIGTQGGGLLRLSPEDRRAGVDRFTAYTERSGLPNAFVYGILEDEAGAIWISTNKGISRLDPATGAVTNYDTTHGLQSLEFNFGAYAIARSGEMFFGGNNGFNAFHPSRVRRNAHAPQIVLTDIIRYDDDSRAVQPAWSSPALELTHRDQVVSFQFAAIDYTAPERNRYAYRLEGFDDSWIDLGTMRRATFTNLPAGRYILRVRASNNDGHWTEAGLALPIAVLPPPWRTWWAYTLYAGCLLALVLRYLAIQRAKLRREAEHARLLEAQVKERTRDLAEANERLREASLTDSLTGLRNRRYLLQYLPDDLALVDRARRKVADGQIPGGGEPTEILFLMIDLDGFKQINDTHGHEAGDTVLLHVRAILRKVCRQSDTIVRWGGDEFLVVCRSITSEGAEVLAERIRGALTERAVDLGNGRIGKIGASIGFAFYPFVPDRPDLLPWERVQAVADRAMYLAKHAGRNAWVGVRWAAGAIPDDFADRIGDLPPDYLRIGLVEVVSSLGPDLVAEPSPAR